MRRQHAMAGREGFTLVEVLAALAIGSVIIVATAALVHDVALHFDRGSRTVDVAERFILAVDRLAADFGSARQVARRTEAGRAVAFSAETGSSQNPGKIVFVGAAPVASAPPGDEVVMLTFERDDNVMRLVRRRAPWPGPNSSFGDVAPDNPVVLIEGKWDISFLLGRLTPGGALTWHPNTVLLVLINRTEQDLADLKAMGEGFKAAGARVVVFDDVHDPDSAAIVKRNRHRLPYHRLGGDDLHLEAVGDLHALDGFLGGERLSHRERFSPIARFPNNEHIWLQD